MNERELAKQKTIRDQRAAKEQAALEAEGKGKLKLKETDEGLMVSPVGQQDRKVDPVVIQIEQGVPTKKDTDHVNEHIDRLVQDNNDDKMSVLSFGKRTDVEAEIHDNTKPKRVVPFDGPLTIAIQKYVGDYEGLWPLLLQPDSELHVEDGQIPCPLELGNLGRRMVSVMDMRDMPSVHHWDSVSYRDKFIAKEQMILSYEVYLIAKQIRKWYVIPRDEGIKLTNELHAWATQVSLKSPFTQAMLMCREHI
jgi:hypothetical protein